MGDIVHNLDRDVVYSMCQYGMGEVPEWGAEMKAQLWRTSGDLEDTWPSMTKMIDVSAKWHSFAKPGNWNDLDMMLLGTLGWDEHKKNRSLWGKVSRNTHLTPNEQYTHMTLWCMMASPLLLGNDLTKLDDFTLRLLTNPEVIAVNQDPLGKQARIVKKHGSEEVWLKELEDGSFALALINRGYVQNKVAVSFKDIGLSGHFVLRDLWRRSDLDGSVQSVSRDIPRHGCYLYKMTSVRAF
jgi:alpha-galactosidase